MVMTNIFQPIISDAKSLQPHVNYDVNDDATMEEDGRRWVAIEIVTSYLYICYYRLSSLTWTVNKPYIS